MTCATSLALKTTSLGIDYFFGFGPGGVVPLLGGTTFFSQPPPSLRTPPCFAGREAGFAAFLSAIATGLALGSGSRGRCGSGRAHGLRRWTRRLRVSCGRLHLLLPAASFGEVVFALLALLLGVVGHGLVLN